MEALALLPTVFWGDWYSRSAVVNMVFSTPLHWDVSVQRPVDTQEAAPAAVCTSAGASGCDKQEWIKKVSEIEDRAVGKCDVIPKIYCFYTHIHTCVRGKGVRSRGNSPRLCRRCVMVMLVAQAMPVVLVVMALGRSDGWKGV